MVTLLPAAVIFVNMDLTDSVRAKIVKQLHITEVISGTVFDQRVTDGYNDGYSDGYYVSTVKAAGLRILVERPYTELTNREQADVVIFVKYGLASILKNNFGPPGQSYMVINLYWGQLGIFT